MSIDAAACILRVARADPAAAKVQSSKNQTAFRYIKAPNCAEVAAKDILRGHIKGFLLLSLKRVLQKGILTDLPAGWVEALRAGRAGLILDKSAENVRLRD